MSVTCFASAASGVGKTTSAIILATTLAKAQRVAVIDADPAGRLLAWSQKAPLPHLLTVTASHGESHIEDEIVDACELNDFVVIDCDNTTSRMNSIVMGMSDLIIVPMGDDPADARGAEETLAHLTSEARHFNNDVAVRILRARTDAASRSPLAPSTNAQVVDRIGAFTAQLHRRAAFSSLQDRGGSLHDMSELEVPGMRAAIGHAEIVTDEVRAVLGWSVGIDGWDARRKNRRFVLPDSPS